MANLQHEYAFRYVICKLRRYKRYLRDNNVYNVISITHEPRDVDNLTIHIHSISPLIVNLCAKNLMLLLDLYWYCGESTFIGTSRITIDNMYGTKSRVLSNWLYSIKINLVFEYLLVSLLRISCKRLQAVMYNPDLLPFELIDLVSDIDPVVSIRYIFDNI